MFRVTAHPTFRRGPVLPLPFDSRLTPLPSTVLSRLPPRRPFQAACHDLRPDAGATPCCGGGFSWCWPSTWLPARRRSSPKSPWSSPGTTTATSSLSNTAQVRPAPPPPAPRGAGRRAAERDCGGLWRNDRAEPHIWHRRTARHDTNRWSEEKRAHWRATVARTKAARHAGPTSIVGSKCSVGRICFVFIQKAK